MPSTVIQIPITGGIDTKVAKEYVDPNSKALAVTNGVFKHDGSIEKRLGCQGLSSAVLTNASFGNPLRVASRKNEILQINGQGLWTYAAQAQAWRGTSQVSPCTITRQPISVTNTSVSLPNYYISFSIAEGAGYRMVACRDASQNIYIDLYDLTTGATLLLKAQPSGSPTGYAPTVIIMGTTAYLFYSIATSAAVGTIWGQTLDLTSASSIDAGWTSQVAIVTDGGVQGTGSATFVPYEATPEVPNNNGILIIYPQQSMSDTGASQHQMRYLRLEALPSLSITASATISSVYASSYCTTCCARYDSAIGYVWFGWEIDAAGTYSQYAVQYTTAWVSVHAVITLAFSALSSSASCVALSVDFETSLQAGARDGMFVAHSNGSTFGSQVSCYDATGTLEYTRNYLQYTITARPFRMTAGPVVHTYVWGVEELNAGYQLVSGSISGLLVDVSVDTGLAGAACSRQCSLGTYLYGDARPLNVTNIGNVTGQVDLLVAAQGSNEFNANTIGNTTQPTAAMVNLVTLDYTGALAWEPVEGDGETFFSGGLCANYDTKQYQELGWVTWPNGITFVNSTSGGTIPNGTYEYAFVFAYVDDAGLVHRSFPWTVSITTSGAGTSSVAFTIPVTPFTLHKSGNGREPVVEIYRTDTNLSTLYFMSGNNFNPGSGVVTFTDTQSLFFATNPLIYTTGGVLPSVNAPAPRCMTRHVERLWIIDDTGLNVWYSQPLNGVDAPYFNEALTLSFTDQTLTALGEMDDKIVIFSATSVWYVEGQGPGTNGQGSDLNVAVQIPSDVGAADWRSVVSFPGGLFFQAPTGGIYLLDRGLGITFKGKDVQDLTSPPGETPNVVISATLNAADTTVRFVLANESGPISTVLVYNYFFDRWSTFVFPQPGEGVGAPFGNVITSTMAGGVWTAATNQGLVIQEKLPSSGKANYDTASSGSSSWVPMTIELPWVKPGGLQGWSQVDIVQGLARIFDPCDLRIVLSYDYGAATPDVKTYTWTQLDAQNKTMAQWRAGPSPANLQPEAISVTLSDATPTGGSATTGAGVQWLGAAFRVTSIGTLYDKLGVGVKQ